jgi:DNA topoisomerase-3
LILKEIKEDYTKPPERLTEAELLAQMERHNIGTDASMPVHITNIINREYVKVSGGNR